MHLNSPKTCIPCTLSCVMLALAPLLLPVQYQPPHCTGTQSPLVEAASTSLPAPAIWTHSPPLHWVPWCPVLEAYLHALPRTINYFPPSAVCRAVNQGLLLRSVKHFRKQAESGTLQIEMRSCCTSLSLRYYIVYHSNSWWHGRCYKHTHTTQKSLEKLVFARFTSRHYIGHHYLLPSIISFFYICQLRKEEIKNVSFSNVGKFWQKSDLSGW